MSLPLHTRTRTHAHTGIWEHNLLTGGTLFTEAGGNRYEERWKDGARDGPRKPLKRSGTHTHTLRRSPHTHRSRRHVRSTRPSAADEEITAVVRSTEPLKWANDSDFSACYKCDETFTFLLRVRILPSFRVTLLSLPLTLLSTHVCALQRHHCRVCGTPPPDLTHARHTHDTAHAVATAH